MMRAATGIALAAMLCLTLAGCARQRMAEPSKEHRGTDKKFSTFAYIEEGKVVTFIVDTHATRDRGTQPYIPIQIAVANNSAKQRKLVITRESFTLVDSEGNRYPMAGTKELMQGYEFLDIDRRLGQIEGLVTSKFAAYTQYPSNFSPGPRDPRVGFDTVSLPYFGYIIDWIYFPTPRTGVRDQYFELFLDSPSLEAPVFLKFEVK